MKNANRTSVALLTALLLFAGNMAARAQSAQQTGDPAKTGSSPAKQSEKKSAAGAPMPKESSSKNSTASTAATTPAPASAAAPVASAPASAPA